VRQQIPFAHALEPPPALLGNLYFGASDAPLHPPGHFPHCLLARRLPLGPAVLARIEQIWNTGFP
jgi:hypothetical protein